MKQIVLGLFSVATVSFFSCKTPKDGNNGGMEDTVSNKPLMKDFMGINGHFHFKPALYGQVCRLVRNYHNIDWDVKKPGDPITIPNTINNINWKRDVYGPWKEGGFETDICVQFASFGGGHDHFTDKWKGQEQWSYNYTKAMASFYGPSGAEKLATSFEIDNEPGRRVDLPMFRNLFVQMAKGIRDGDPKAKVVTPTIHARPADDYSQDVHSFYGDADVLPLYDVLNVHTYSTIPKSGNNPNNWNRTWPEDTSAVYLKVVQETIDWRNSSAKGKEIWVTEFGYDACTPDVMKDRKDWWEKLDWQGHTDLQQAQYLVRSFLAFATMDVNRAYLYYYNDDNEPSFHAASGLTRKFEPKMSFHAVKQLYETLGNFRFSRIVKQDYGQLYVYEFSNATNRIWVAWSPTGVKSHEKEGYQPREARVTLTGMPGKPISAKTMATAAGDAPNATWEQVDNNSISITIGESPTYILMKK
ncbi:glycoside hydrolase family 5 protein [Chitinophaga niabensis]|uniref:Glycosyl hydrolase catalytic core n=1 Tax=Chitinophaga niabensis TaxID=536979 RepID=A0A1N6DDK3_9BACT|nr:hypothetical protein [Chitinophaga niabensis]SIN68909.1 hypothetical protein SAMN04488055_0645 [Chitinophaga niabensis]